MEVSVENATSTSLSRRATSFRKYPSSPHPGNVHNSSRSKMPMSFKYASDGSGRDSYVCYNAGGLQASYFPGGKYNFQKTLRANHRIHDPRKPSPTSRRYNTQGSDKANSSSPDSRLMTDFDEWQSWNPALQTFDFKKMANLQKLQSERLAIPRDNGIYYKRYLQHKANLSFDGNLLSSFKKGRPEQLDKQNFSFERNRGLTLSTEAPTPTALRVKMTDSPNRLHVTANFAKDQKKLRKEIKSHKEEMLKEIKELRARSSKVYNKMQEQREYNKTLSPRNTVLQALAKNGLKEVYLQPERPKSGMGIIAALNQKIKGRETPLSTRDDSKPDSRPSSSFSRNQHFPKHKTQAFTKQSLFKENYLDQPLNNLEVLNGRKAATEKVSPRSKTVLSNY